MAKKKRLKKQPIPISHKKKTKTPSLVIASGFWKKNIWAAAILLVVSFGLYFQSINYDYVLDDRIVYHENGLVKKGLAGVREIFTTESMVGYFGEQKNLLQGSRYRPLSIVTFAVEQEFFGNHSYKIEEYWVKQMAKNPAIAPYLNKVKIDAYVYEEVFPDEKSFLNALAADIPQSEIDKNKDEILFHAAYSDSGISHLINVFLYALVVLLLFRVMSIIFPPKKSVWYLTMAFVIALLFALHPIHVEVVANVKGRDEILALLGALGAMYFSLKYIADEKIHHLILSGVIFLFGLLAKENVITFLAVVPLTIYFFTKSSFRKNAISLIPLVIATLVFLYLRKEAVDAAHIFDFDAGKASVDLMNNPFVEMNGSEQYATIFYTLGLYVKLLLFPHPLTHDYYPYQIPIMDWGKMGSILSLILYLAMGVFALWGLKKKNTIAYGILFFLIPLSVVSNLVISVGTFMNDRFLFFSSIGFCIIVAYLITQKLPKPVLNLGLLAILVLGYTAKTFTRVPDWKDGYSLNISGIKNSPNSARANLYMSTAIFKRFFKKETDPNKKLDYLNQVTQYVNRALEIHPKYGSALTMKVIVATEHFRTDRDVSKLLKTFEEVLKIRRTDANIDIYLNHLRDNVSGSTQELVDFCHRIGYEFFIKRAGEYDTGMKYINFGLSVSPGNAQLLQDAKRN